MNLGIKQGGGVAKLDLEILLKTRALVTASSGGGKTGVLYALCEALASKVQIIVLDPEGEFAPLRQRHPFLLVGPDGETPAMVRTAKMLAHRLLELNVSAICDIYELPPASRHEFVRDFLDAMVDAPKALWHPVIVILDEGHVFAPEKGQGESVAAQAVINMASRGRKRGFCLVVATQRLAKLSKNVASELQNQLIGRTTQIDQARAADVLNISGKAARDEFGRMIGQMPTGDFIAYGMAFHLPEPVRISVPRPQTLPDGHGRRVVPPPPPASIAKFLPQIADLPAEVEQKQKTEVDLRREIVELKKQLAAKPKPAPVVQAGITPERERMLLKQIGDLQTTAEAYEAAMNSVVLHAADIAKAAKGIADEIATVQKKAKSAAKVIAVPAPKERVLKAVPAEPPALPPPSSIKGREELTGPELRVLDAIAWWEALDIPTPEMAAAAHVAGYAYTSSSFKNPRASLGVKGLIYAANGMVGLTESGRAVAVVPEIERTNEALHEAVLSKLAGPEKKLLKPLLEAFPRGITQEALAEESGYARTSSSFKNPRAKLGTLGLIEMRDGAVYAKEFLFPES